MLKQLFNAFRHSWVVGAPVLQKPHPFSSSGELCLDEKICTDCGACIRSCPVGALAKTTEQAGKSLTGLFFSPARCIACVRCLEACPSKALSFRPGEGFLIVPEDGVKHLKTAGSREGKTS